MTESTVRMIIPTIGRIVLFHPAGGNPGPAGVPRRAALTMVNQPLAAIIAHVWSDLSVNLMVIDENGNPSSKTNVALVQGDMVASPNGDWCGWPEYHDERLDKAAWDARQAEIVKKAAKDAPAIAAAEKAAAEAEASRKASVAAAEKAGR